MRRVLVGPARTRENKPTEVTIGTMPPILNCERGAKGRTMSSAARAGVRRRATCDANDGWSDQGRWERNHWI